jgi:hypothetical protein
MQQLKVSKAAEAALFLRAKLLLLQLCPNFW